MAKSKQKRKKSRSQHEAESTYLLKLVMYLIVGSQWVHFTHGNWQFPLPLGLMVGLVFAMHDHFKIDRKIEYAVLLVAMLIGFYSQIGIYLTV